MAKRKTKSLARPGEPKQKTRKGLQIPVPTRKEFFGDLDIAATKEPSRQRRGKSSR